MALRERLYLSTIAAHAPELAARYGLGLEVAEYCTAAHLDQQFAVTDQLVREKIAGCGRLILHAPFNELCPAAIDPLVVAVTERRYRQAAQVAAGYGCRRLVVHSGYLAQLYDAQWFAERSVQFWKRFLAEQPSVTLFLENVFEDSPQLLLQIVREVADPRLRLCLDLGHANTALSPVSPAQWLAQCGESVSHIHLHNNDGVHDLHQELPEGCLPMRELLCQVLAVCPQATITLEVQDGRPSVQWLAEQGFLEQTEV